MSRPRYSPQTAQTGKHILRERGNSNLEKEELPVKKIIITINHTHQNPSDHVLENQMGHVKVYRFYLISYGWTRYVAAIYPFPSLSIMHIPLPSLYRPLQMPPPPLLFRLTYSWLNLFPLSRIPPSLPSSPVVSLLSPFLSSSPSFPPHSPQAGQAGKDVLRKS